MRRTAYMVSVVVMVTTISGAALAQEATPEPSAADLVARADLAVAEAEKAVQESQNAVNLAFNLLGLFEAISFLVTVIAGAGALFGVTRLISAQQELTKARERVEAELAESRERFAKDLEAKERDLNALRDELTRSAQRQREDAAKASLAQSLMPLGERQYRSQDYIGALDTYKRALELDPDNLIIHYRMGYVYTQSGELELADKHLTSALEIEPGFAPALAALGYVYRRMGEKMPQGVERDLMLNKSEEHMLEALKISPKLVDDDGESWWGSLGGLYRRRGQVDQAIYAYERATEVTPHSSYGFGNLATLYGQKQEIGKMRETYKRVEQLAWSEVQADVDNYWAYADLLVSRLALGKVKEADEIIDTVLETAPADSPYTLEMLIETLTRIGTLLKDEDTGAIQRSIQRTRQFLEKRKAQQEAEAQKRKTGEVQAVTPG